MLDTITSFAKFICIDVVVDSIFGHKFNIFTVFVWDATRSNDMAIYAYIAQTHHKPYE